MLGIESSGSEPSSFTQFQFVGGDVCLDFCNTVGGRRGGTAREKLHTYLDLLSWARQAGIVDEALAEALARRAAQQPDEALATLERGIRLREAIYQIFLALVEEKPPEKEDLDELNEELGTLLGRLRVAPQNKCHFAWQWSGDGQALDLPLGPVARAAAELLTAHERWCRLRQCKGENCGWLFLDGSKNHSRCWCDMRDCGNRAKVRRHRLKDRRGNRSEGDKTERS